MTTKLGLYNEALREIGERRLASLTEAQPMRYRLDDVYTSAIRYVLEQGLWNTAMRSIELPAQVSIDPNFGYDYAFEQPSDLVRLAALCSDASMIETVREYADERGYWWANVAPLYVSYVSDDTEYGLDLSRWPETLARFAALELAERIVVPGTASESKLERIDKMRKRALIDARSKDAMSGPNRKGVRSSWLQARMSGSSLDGTGRGL